MIERAPAQQASSISVESFVRLPESEQVSYELHDVDRREVAEERFLTHADMEAIAEDVIGTMRTQPHGIKAAHEAYVAGALDFKHRQFAQILVEARALKYGHLENEVSGSNYNHNMRDVIVDNQYETTVSELTGWVATARGGMEQDEKWADVIVGGITGEVAWARLLNSQPEILTQHGITIEKVLFAAPDEDRRGIDQIVVATNAKGRRVVFGPDTKVRHSKLKPEEDFVDRGRAVRVPGYGAVHNVEVGLERDDINDNFKLKEGSADLQLLKMAEFINACEGEVIRLPV